MAPRPSADDPRRSFLRRPSAPLLARTTSNDAEAISSGTKTKEDTEDIRMGEVNLRLQQLGLPPREKEANTGEIFARFLHIAKQKGVYISNNGLTYEDAQRDEGHDDEENKQYDSDATTEGGTEDEAMPVAPIEGEKKFRGPTALKAFWKKFEPSRKVVLEFNHLGQPANVNTSDLANFIGSLVKGKEISLEYTHWAHVPKHLKEKLWNTVKAFFEIEDIYKNWVIRSAGKKWKDFKCWLKMKYYDDELTELENILNGCGNRIPPSQWKWLCEHWKTERAMALSELNKVARQEQDNATHTTGSRAFAVVQEQEEIKLGRKIGRAEVYRITHTKRDGQPVCPFAADKIKKINEKLEENPALLGEDASENDLYSTLFPKGKKSFRHGLGLVVGGRGIEQLARVIVDLHECKKELHESKKDNMDLKGMLIEQMERSARLEEKLSQAMVLFQASQKEQPSEQRNHHNQEEEDGQGSEAKDQDASNWQQTSRDKHVEGSEAKEREVPTRQQEIPSTPVERSQPKGFEAKEKDASRLQQTRHKEVHGSKAQDKYALKRKRQNNPKEIEGSQANERDDPTRKKPKARSQLGTANLIQENRTQDVDQENHTQDGVFPRKTSYKTAYRTLSEQPRDASKVHKIKVEKAEENLRIYNDSIKDKKKVSKKIEPGIEVALKSPYSEEVVALGTVQAVEGDHIQVMVNLVMKSTTMLPRAQGRMTVLGHAEAHSVAWPKRNVTTEILDRNYAEMVSHMDKGLRVHSRSDGKKPLTIEELAELEVKRRSVKKRSLKDIQSQASQVEK